MLFVFPLKHYVRVTRVFSKKVFQSPKAFLASIRISYDDKPVTHPTPRRTFFTQRLVSGHVYGQVLAQSLYGVFPGPLGQCISVTYPRRMAGRRLDKLGVRMREHFSGKLKMAVPNITFFGNLWVCDVGRVSQNCRLFA